MLFDELSDATITFVALINVENSRNVRSDPRARRVFRISRIQLIRRIFSAATRTAMNLSRRDCRIFSVP